MTPYGTLSSAAQGVFGVLALLLMTAAVYVLVAACTLRLRKLLRVGAAFLAAVSVLLLQGIGDVACCAKEGITPLLFAGVTARLPAVAIALLLALLAAAEAVFLWRLKKTRTTTLTPMSAKESLDALPDGICFFTADGQPLLVNTQMNRICAELFDAELLNAADFCRRLYGGAGNAAYLRTEPTLRIRTKDAKVWEFRLRTLTVGNTEVRELVACDVTTLCRLSGELDARNRSLKLLNERLRRYGSEVEKSTMEHELLAAKIRVHDNVGRSLLALRAYLEQPPSERDREALLLLWRHTAAVLRNEAEPEKQRSDWALLQKAAQSVDVQIEKEGALPEAQRERAVILTALHECLTNTVKHAKGNRLYITLRTEGNVLTAELRNNGAPPRGEIQETGGLKNLRRAVEKVGGSMTVEACPAFLLRLALPKGELEAWENGKL